MHRVSIVYWVTLLLSLAACETRGAEQQAAETPAPRVFGELVVDDGPVTPLTEIAADPARFEGQRVRTEGTIERVCQRRGCWLELADAAGARAFVPMAGHAFVVPMDSVGQAALIEGTVHRRQRSAAERKHLESDGAGSEIPALSVQANAVVVRE
ncbi:MAG: DUF4920 domain-containing protein [Myxococcota bacterium]